MADAYKIITAVKSPLAKPNDKVGRPMSLKVVFFVWLALLVIGPIGAYDFYIGGVF